MRQEGQNMTKTTPASCLEQVPDERCNGTIRAEIKAHLDLIRRLEEASVFVSYIIAAGILREDSLGEGWPSVVEVLASRDPQCAKANATYGDLPIGDPMSSVISTMAEVHARYGYLLGLAVGMAIGPNGLKVSR